MAKRTTIVGLRDVTNRINKLGVTARLQAANRVRSAALDVQRKAKQKVNVDTGRLRSSIHILQTSLDGRQVEVGSNVHYAASQEFGENGKPYLRPAVEEVRPKFEKEMRDILG